MADEEQGEDVFAGRNIQYYVEDFGGGFVV